MDKVKDEGVRVRVRVGVRVRVRGEGVPDVLFWWSNGSFPVQCCLPLRKEWSRLYELIVYSFEGIVCYFLFSIELNPKLYSKPKP